MATTVLITGANRGIGRGILDSYLARPNHTVIAAVRDPSSATALSLKDLPLASGTSFLLVKIDGREDTDPAAAVKLMEEAGISHLDIVIANAGVADVNRVEDTSMATVRDIFEVNIIAVIALYQAIHPMLKATADKGGAGNPIFAAISSAAGGTLDMEEYGAFVMGVYGGSKAALNHIVRRAHFENDWLNAFLVHPGFVQTDMGNVSAKLFGIEAPVTVKDSVGGILNQIDGATRETKSGKFWSFDGTELRW